MRHPNSFIASLAILIGVACNSVSAQTTNGFGTHASTGTASNCPSFCTSANGGDFQSDRGGGEFIASASSSENTYGVTQAFAALSGDSFLPDLRVFSSSGANRGADATAFAVQGFTFGDSTARDILLDVNLHADITGLGESAGASVAVLLGSELTWFPDYATLVFEEAELTTTQLALGNTFVNDTTAADTNTQLAFTLNPGDDFFVVASLRASTRNGTVDALNTLSLSFDDSSGITAALVAVPEPTSVALIGLLGAAMVCRRQRSP